MSNVIMIEGKSGVGKTRSLLNLDPKTTFLYQVIYKSLPFKGWEGKYPLFKADTKTGNRKVIYNQEFMANGNSQKEAYNKASEDLCKSLLAIPKVLPHIKTIVIDDTQYLMAYEYMSRGREKGFDKFSEIQLNFFKVVQTSQLLPDDVTVFLLHHTDESDPNNIRAKTVGKMIDNSITLEGIFPIVLHANARKENGKIKYFFATHSDGCTTAKSPEGMFEDEIENDLQLVITKIKEYNN